MVNKPLIRPYFWGGYVGGGWLNSHEQLQEKSVDFICRGAPMKAKKALEVAISGTFVESHFLERYFLLKIFENVDFPMSC